MEEGERREGMEGGEGCGGGGGKEGRKEGKMLSLLFPISNTKKAKSRTRMAPDNRAQLASRV